MPSFSVTEEADVLLITVDDADAMNDSRSSAFRDAFHEAIQSHDARLVAVDLHNVDFLSSTGVAILVIVKRKLDGKQGKIVLFGLHPAVFDLLRVMRLTQYFLIADNHDSALTMLRPPPAV